MTPIIHRHHLIQQTTETMSSSLINSKPSTDRTNIKAPTQALEHLHDPSHEHRPSKESTTKNRSLQSRQTSGEEREASLETIHSDPSLTYESPALHSATTTNTNRKIFNRWLNKEVPYTTMDSTRSPPMTSPMSSQDINLNTTTRENSNMITNSRHRSPLSHQQVSHFESNTSMESTTEAKLISNQRLTSQSHQTPTNSKNMNSPTSPPKHQSEILLQSETRHRESNLAINYMEERNQILPKRPQEAPVSSRDLSRRKTVRVDSKSPQVHQTQRHLERQRQLEESPERSQNRKRAETLWGKEIDLDANQVLCRNSLPRLSPAHEARSKMLSSIDAQIDNVELEIQDILAKPLLAEITISSPSLFDETSTNSSQSSSPPITVQTLK